MTATEMMVITVIIAAGLVEVMKVMAIARTLTAVMVKMAVVSTVMVMVMVFDDDGGGHGHGHGHGGVEGGGHGNSDGGGVDDDDGDRDGDGDSDNCGGNSDGEGDVDGGDDDDGDGEGDGGDEDRDGDIDDFDGDGGVDSDGVDDSDSDGEDDSNNRGGVKGDRLGVVLEVLVFASVLAFDFVEVIKVLAELVSQVIIWMMRLEVLRRLGLFPELTQLPLPKSRCCLPSKCLDRCGLVGEIVFSLKVCPHGGCGMAPGLLSRERERKAEGQRDSLLRQFSLWFPAGTGGRVCFVFSAELGGAGTQAPSLCVPCVLGFHPGQPGEGEPSHLD